MNPQYVILFHHFRRFLEKAAAEGVDVVPLKGAHLLTSVYGPDGDRGLMADVDFLVREADWKTSHRLLEGLGFVARPSPLDEDHQKEKGFHLPVDDGRHILFEAHRALFAEDRFPIDHDALWARTAPSTFDGVCCRRMSGEDVFCHVAFHAAVHRFMNLPRAVEDLRRVLTLSDVSLPAIVERADQWHCRRAVWFFLHLLARRVNRVGVSAALDALSPPLPVRAALAALPAAGGDTRIACLHHRLQAAIVWPLVFDRPSDLLRMVRHHPFLVERRRPA
jgi:hypothetical protein